MKKKFIYSFMIAAAAAAFSSCSNFLEERPTDAFDEETAFQSPTLVYVTRLRACTIICLRSWVTTVMYMT